MSPQAKLFNNQLILIVCELQGEWTAVETCLMEAGFVTESCCGSEIADSLTRLCPDMIILAPRLPGDDIRLLDTIRSTQGKETVPVILAAESIGKELLVRIQEDGALDYTGAPVQAELILFRVRQLLRITLEMKAHAESRERLANAHRVASLGHWEWYPETGIFRISTEIARILGLGHGLQSTTIESFLLAVIPEDRTLMEKGLRNAFQNSCECSLECRIMAGKVAQRIIRLQGCEDKTARGRNQRLTGIIQDLTSQRQMEDRLEMLMEAVDSLPIGITLSDVNGRIIYSNPTEARIHGYEVEDLIGREASQFARKNLRKPLTALMLQEMGVWKRESTNLKKNGQEFPVQLTSIAVRNADRYLGVVTTCEDISERKEAQKKIYRLAHLDPLTELPNRRMFQDRLSHALALARREEGKVSIIYLDLDNFKDVNDTQGHDFGDKLLQNVASRLSAIMRESDTLARLGGDEFVVIMVSVNKQEDFASAAQRMLSVFSQPFEINNRLIYSSVSIGIAVFPDDGDNSDLLLKCADTAMYQVKQEGKSGFRFFSNEMNERIMRRVAMESALRNGLGKGEFFLHYQPLWDMATNRIIGAEALIRWQSRDFGLMLPGDFISLIEDSGLIFTIGEWVLRTACLQARYWRASGHKQFRVAINISGKQLKQPDFLAVIAGVLRESGVNPCCIDLEFTESVIMEQAEKTIETLWALKKMGICLSIDDFGTGYSSLNYLKNFPIDRIKIDRSFISDINSSMDNAAIVQAIISLARVLRLKVIAEGIENSDQLHSLQELGCHEMQGFLLGKPMAAEELATFLERINISS